MSCLFLNVNKKHAVFDSGIQPAEQIHWIYHRKVVNVECKNDIFIECNKESDWFPLGTHIYVGHSILIKLFGIFMLKWNNR